MNKLIVDNIIRRYDYQYTNCFSGKIISWLSYKEYPVKLLFYNFYEKTQDLFDFFVRDFGKRFKYKIGLSLEDLNIVGANIVVLPQRDFSENKIEIINQLDLGKIVLISCNSFYIPHGLNFQLREGPHHFMLTGYDSNKQKVSMVDEDFKSYINGGYSYYEYEWDTIEKAFIHSRKRIAYIDLTTTASNASEQIYLKFISNMDSYYDDFTMFDKLISVLKKHDGNSLKKGDLISPQIFNMFKVLSGSRKLFSEYMETISAPSVAIQNIREAAILSDLISKLIEYQEDCDINEIIGKIKILERYEKENYRVLKESSNKIINTRVYAAMQNERSEFFITPD